MSTIKMIKTCSTYSTALRQPVGALETVATVHVHLSKGQPDGAEKTVDVDTDGTLETVDVDMGSNS